MASLALALFVLCLASLASSCPQSCSCFRTVVSCFGEDINSIPLGIPLTTTELRIHETNISEVHFPEMLPQMKILRVTRSKVTKFDSSLANLSADLSQLHLTGNQIDMVNFSSGLENINTLSLDRNRLDRFEAHMFKLPNLIYLSLESNIISTIDFTGLERVTELRLAGNLIKGIDSSLFNMPNLQTLRVGGDTLEYLNLSSGCQKLVALGVDNVNISNFDGYFDHLPVLERLSLRHNRISSLILSPNLVKLQELDLTGNLLTSIDLSPLVQLKTLFLDHNQFSEATFLHGLLNVEYLYLDGNSFMSFDVSDMNSLNLRMLSLSGNQLTSFRLPKAMRGPDVLKLDRNKLAEFDLSYMENPKIKYLYLEHNKLKFLDVTQLYHLVYLNLGSNLLTNVFFNQFTKLPELRGLELANNPVYCDCCIEYLLKTVTISSGLCAKPPELTGTSLQNLASLLNCSGQEDCTNPANALSSSSNPFTELTSPTSAESSSDFAGIPIYLFVLIILLGVAFLAIAIAMGLMLIKRSARKNATKSCKRLERNLSEEGTSTNIASDNLAYEYSADIFDDVMSPSPEKTLESAHELATFSQGYDHPVGYKTFNIKRVGSKLESTEAVESEDKTAYIAPRSSSYIDLHSKL